jgi:hypothetical protein
MSPPNTSVDSIIPPVRLLYLRLLLRKPHSKVIKDLSSEIVQYLYFLYIKIPDFFGYSLTYPRLQESARVCIRISRYPFSPEATPLVKVDYSFFVLVDSSVLIQVGHSILVQIDCSIFVQVDRNVLVQVNCSIFVQVDPRILVLVSCCSLVQID